MTVERSSCARIRRFAPSALVPGEDVVDDADADVPGSVGEPLAQLIRRRRLRRLDVDPVVSKRPRCLRPDEWRRRHEQDLADGGSHRTSEVDIKTEPISLLWPAPHAVNRRLQDYHSSMVQRKKPAVREAILAGGLPALLPQGYAATMVADIAQEAGVSPGNVYIYFESKLEILYTIYDPWLRVRIESLESELAAISRRALRLRRLLVALWREIPAEKNGFLNNIMQAISVHEPVGGLSLDARALARKARGRDDRRRIAARPPHTAREGPHRARADHGVRRIRNRPAPAPEGRRNRRSHARCRGRDVAGRQPRFGSASASPGG